jgi:hypothetical protein
MCINKVSLWSVNFCFLFLYSNMVSLLNWETSNFEALIISMILLLSWILYIFHVYWILSINFFFISFVYLNQCSSSVINHSSPIVYRQPLWGDTNDPSYSNFDSLLFYHSCKYRQIRHFLPYSYCVIWTQLYFVVTSHA